MKQLLYAAGLFALVASTYSQGQTIPYHQRLFAQIPFEFRTGDRVMPAGNYIIDQKGDLLTVAGGRGMPSAMILTQFGPKRTPRPEAILEFKRYKNEYFLSKLWSPNVRESLAVPRGKREKELERQLTFVKSDEVAVRTIPVQMQDVR